MEVIDISHPIKAETDLSFRKEDITPSCLYLEDATEGIFYIHTQLNDLLMTYGTHICFPGCLTRNIIAQQNRMPVGKYKIENFLGKVFIIDVSFLYEKLMGYYKNGILSIDLYSKTEVDAYLEELSSLNLKKINLTQCLDALDQVSGVIFYTGLSKFWCYKKFDLMEYVYFQSFNLSKALCDYLIDLNIKFVGVDSFSLGNPFSVYSGHEKLFSCSRDALNLYSSIISNNNCHDAHDYFLNNEVFIYKNLKLYKNLSGKIFTFSGVPLNIQISDMDTSSVVRPYLYE